MAFGPMRTGNFWYKTVIMKTIHEDIETEMCIFLIWASEAPVNIVEASGSLKMSRKLALNWLQKVF